MQENKIGILALTPDGFKSAIRISDRLDDYQIYIHSSIRECLNDSASKQRIISFEHLRDLLPKIWLKHRSFVFIMASGIVVRQIAPLISRKDIDPAVIVIDDLGKFIIPLLSGHLGGANALARELAYILEATPVITTASDNRGLISPDEYTRVFGWKLDTLKSLSKVNRKLLDQGFLQFFTDIELDPQHPLLRAPSYIQSTSLIEADVIISGKQKISTEINEKDSKPRIILIPPIYSVGIGCKAGTSKEDLDKAFLEAINILEIDVKAIVGIFSICLKQRELGILELAKFYNLQFRTFPRERIQEINEQERLEKSVFVREMIGVDGVCEAASLLGTKNGRIILPKLKVGPVTIAVSEEKYLLSESVQEI